MNPAGFEIELKTPLGPIRGRVQVDPGPMRLMDLVGTAYELTNIFVERAKQRKEQEGRKVSCRAGCGTCCVQMAALSIPEVFFVADLVESLPPARQRGILTRFEEIVGELERRKLTGELLTPEYSDDAALTIAREYFFLGMPCPFLADQSCSIHPFRPISCREYNVTSPAEWCSDPYQHELAKVPMPLPLSAPLGILTARLTGAKPRLVPLTLALRFAAGNAELRNKTWPGLELFEKFMAVIGKKAKEE